MYTYCSGEVIVSLRVLALAFPSAWKFIPKNQTVTHTTCSLTSDLFFKVRSSLRVPSKMAHILEFPLWLISNEPS